MKIYGHCRFSYFGLSDTGRAIGSVEDAFQKLWHPVRMAVRFHLMESLLLPVLRAQTDPDFRFVILASEIMPEPFQLRLDRIVADLPQVQVLRTAQRDIGKAMRPVMIEASNGYADPAVHFRVDDDDAVSTDYVARLRRAAAKMEPGGMITFPSGVLGFLEGEGARHCTYQAHSIAIGLALVTEPVRPRNPFTIQHMKHSSGVPSYTDPTFPAYHYTLHSVNNTVGYAKVFHVDPAERKRIRRSLAIYPELAAGRASTTAADTAIAEAFPHTTGETMRAAIARTGRPVDLAEEMGFPMEPFAPPAA